MCERYIKKDKEIMKKENTKPTYVLEATHKKVKGFAGLKGMDIPEAYDLLVVEGLKALNFQLPGF